MWSSGGFYLLKVFGFCYVESGSTAVLVDFE